LKEKVFYFPKLKANLKKLKKQTKLKLKKVP